MRRSCRPSQWSSSTFVTAFLNLLKVRGTLSGADSFFMFFFTFDQNYILCNLKVPCGEFLRSVEPRLRTSVLSVQLHNALTLFGVGHFHTATLESAGAWGN